VEDSLLKDSFLEDSSLLFGHEKRQIITDKTSDGLFNTANKRQVSHWFTFLWLYSYQTWTAWGYVSSHLDQWREITRPSDWLFIKYSQKFWPDTHRSSNF